MQTCYFIERKENFHPRGALYNRYHNEMRKLREKGLIERKNKIYKNKTNEEKDDLPYAGVFIFEFLLLNVCVKIPTYIFCFLDEEYENEKMWLSFNKQPWPTIEEKWKKTHTLRHQEILSCKDNNIKTILRQWPLYEHSYGHRLVS